jgi:hypothetical protein
MPAWLVAQQSEKRADKTEKSQKDTAQSKETQKPAPQNLHAIGAFGGKLLSVEEDGKTFVLRVYGQTAKPQFVPGNPASC